VTGLIGLPWIAGLIWQNGGDVFDASLTHCLLDVTAALGALQFDADLTSRYAVVPPASAKTISMNACNAFGIAKGAKNAASAWALTVFTTGDTAQQLIQQSRGGVPPRASVAAAPALRSVYQPWEDPQVYQDALQHARPSPTGAVHAHRHSIPESLDGGPGREE
jgi:hypothetical protein